MAWTAASSAWERWDPNQYILCPYNTAHRILASRFQRHLVRCRKNHPDKDFVSCPFNASHQILRPHLRSHICSCPDKNVIEPAFNAYGKDERSYHLKGDTSVPSYYSANPEEPEEDWDREIDGDEPAHNVVHENTTSFKRYTGSMLSHQNREQIKREIKQKSLAEDINQRWLPNPEPNRTFENSEEGSFNSNTGYQSLAKTCRQDSENESALNLAGIGRGRLVSNAYERKYGGCNINTAFR